MKDYKNWLIGGLCVGLGLFAWLAVACSRNEAMADIYKECNSYTMWEDGSFVCEKYNGVRFYGCISKAKCED